MKFSFLTYQFCRFGLEHSFKMAQEYGFEGVEVWGGRPHAYAHDMGREEIQAILGWKKQYWDLLQPQDAMSRHRGAKPLRRCELLGVISLLSPG